ncbi:MAG TPA: hypothetical protein DCP02_00725, partial [Actinobacteria bacterium]|nr:hypothetical protein [Actinomycetota bacterium]
MMHMKIPKDKVKVKIKTESAVIMGTVHTMVNGRLSDYMTAQKEKFLPVTDAEVFYLTEKINKLADNGKKREIILVNT